MTSFEEECRGLRKKALEQEAPVTWLVENLVRLRHRKGRTEVSLRADTKSTASTRQDPHTESESPKRLAAE
jgi:hypothetical protein